MVWKFPRAFSRAFAVVALLVFGVLGATPASAHSGKQSYLYVSVFGTQVEGRVEMPVADLARVLEITIPDATEPARAAIIENRALIQGYLDEHVVLSDDGAAWDLVYDEEFGILPTDKGAYVLLPFDVDETFDDEPRSFTARFDVIYEADPNRDNLVIIENDWRSATFNNEAVEIVGLSTGITEQRIELESVSTLSSLSTIRQLGSDVGRLQFELLFTVIALVVPVGLLSVAAGNRREAPSTSELFNRGRRSLLAFVATQAVALWVVALGSIELSLRLTAAIGAAGLFVASAPIVIVWWQPRFGRLLPIAAAAAGVANGIAVGAGATRLGLHRSRPVLSILTYHVGVVIVVGVVALSLGFIVLQLRQSRFAPTIAAGIGLVLVALSIGWIYEQVAQQSVPIETLTNPFQALWRQLAVLVVLLMAATALRSYDRRAGHPRTVHQSA